MKKRILSIALAITIILAMNVTAFAANVTVTDDYKGDYKFSYSISNYIETERYQIADASKWTDSPYAYANVGKTINVYKVNAGTTIKAPGAFSYFVGGLDYKNGKLEYYGDLPDDSLETNFDWTRVNKEDGSWHEQFSSKANFRLYKKGYYLVAFSPYIYHNFETNKGWTDKNKLKYYTAVIHVVGNDDSANEVAAKPDNKPSPTPANENTVEVAGYNRTPGQLQAIRSGEHAGASLYTVNYGDTLYGIAKRFYGNGDLWKELQAANQENINETVDGKIFVGFNLVIPAELGGVRSKI